jgi:hypothetical protein
MIGAAVWLGTLWGRLALGAGVVMALVGVRAWDVSNQRTIGETRAVVRIERASENAAKIGRQAAEKSRAARHPGRVQSGADRDPTTRND